jgi:hypothetical protein
MDGVQEKLSVIGQGAFAIAIVKRFVQCFKVKKAREGIRFGEYATIYLSLCARGQRRAKIFL